MNIRLEIKNPCLSGIFYFEEMYYICSLYMNYAVVKYEPMQIYIDGILCHENDVAFVCGCISNETKYIICKHNIYKIYINVVNIKYLAYNSFNETVIHFKSGTVVWVGNDISHVNNLIRQCKLKNLLT